MVCLSPGRVDGFRWRALILFDGETPLSREEKDCR